MSTHTSLERLYHRAVKYPDPSQRFQALRTAFEATEDAISHQAAQHKIRAKAGMSRSGMHPDDI